MTQAPLPVAPLGRAVQILLGLQLVTLAALIVPVVHAFQRPARGDDTGLSLAVAGVSSPTITALTLVDLILLLGTAAVWIAWIRRCRANVDAWGARFQRESTRWVVGGWLCPVANIWLGYRIVRDLADDTVSDPGAEAVRRRQPLVLAWGIAWTALNLTTWVHVRNEWWAMFGFAVIAVAAVLAICVCRLLTNAQTQRIRARTPAARP